MRIPQEDPAWVLFNNRTMADDARDLQTRIAATESSRRQRDDLHVNRTLSPSCVHNRGRRTSTLASKTATDPGPARDLRVPPARPFRIAFYPRPMSILTQILIFVAWGVLLFAYVAATLRPTLNDRRPFGVWRSCAVWSGLLSVQGPPSLGVARTSERQELERAGGRVPSPA